MYVHVGRWTSWYKSIWKKKIGDVTELDILYQYKFVCTACEQPIKKESIVKDTKVLSLTCQVNVKQVSFRYVDKFDIKCQLINSNKFHHSLWLKIRFRSRGQILSFRNKVCLFFKTVKTRSSAVRSTLTEYLYPLLNKFKINLKQITIIYCVSFLGKILQIQMLWFFLNSS